MPAASSFQYNFYMKHNYTHKNQSGVYVLISQIFIICTMYIQSYRFSSAIHCAAARVKTKPKHKSSTYPIYHLISRVHIQYIAVKYIYTYDVVTKRCWQFNMYTGQQQI